MNSPVEIVPPEQPLALSSVSGVNVEALLSKAIDAKSAVEVLERLMVMRREARAEAAKEAFDRDLAGFQRECPTIQKRKKVHSKDGKVRYAYAPLESIVEQVKELLERHGFSHSESAEVKPGWVKGFCKVTHKLGHSEVSTFEVPIDPDAYMNEAQKFASAFTFVKRYSFCAAFGILTGDEDDDSGASGEPKEIPKQKVVVVKQTTTAPVKPKTELSDQEKADREMFLSTLRKQMGNPELEKYVVRYLQCTKDKKGVVMLAPWEKLEDLHLVYLKGLVNGWENAYPAIELWLQENPEDGDLGPSQEPWRSFPMPWGPNAGKLLGELPKNTLFGLWANVKVETEWKGRPIAEEKIAKSKVFRQYLDDAGKYYSFRKKEDKEAA